MGKVTETQPPLGTEQASPQTKMSNQDILGVLGDIRGELGSLRREVGSLRGEVAILRHQADASHYDVGNIAQAQYQLGQCMQRVENKVGQNNDQLAYVYQQSGQSWSMTHQMTHQNQQILFQLKNHLVDITAELMVSTEDNKTFISAQQDGAALEKNQLQKILSALILSSKENVSLNMQTEYREFMQEPPVASVPEAMRPNARNVRVQQATVNIHHLMSQPR